MASTNRQPVVDQDDHRWHDGYITTRLRGVHVTEPSFWRAVLKFAEHTSIYMAPNVPAPGHERSRAGSRSSDGRAKGSGGASSQGEADGCGSCADSGSCEGGVRGTTSAPAATPSSGDDGFG